MLRKSRNSENLHRWKKSGSLVEASVDASLVRYANEASKIEVTDIDLEPRNKVLCSIARRFLI